MTCNAVQIEPAGVPKMLDRLVRMRRAHAWLLALLSVDLAALGDLVSGPGLWFGPIYLFVICLATWSLGWRAGQGLGIACMGLTFAINGLSLYPYGGAQFAWNLAMRFTAVSVIIAIIAGVRRAYVREWWLARTDILTGALNRQAFFELGGSLSASGAWRLLAYADLDGLKRINDGRGHEAGDTCLKAFAAQVRRMIRRDDMFARVGGDEFLIFMAVRDEESARAVATRLHGAMNRIPADSGRHLRCSVGALVIPPGPLSIDELVRRADGLMYQAKLRGACLEFGIVSDARQAANARRARSLPRSPAPGFPIGRREVERRADPGAAAIARPRVH